MLFVLLPQLDLSKFVEVTGRANPDGSVEGWITTNIGDDFGEGWQRAGDLSMRSCWLSYSGPLDLPTYSSAIELMEKFPQPFQE